MSDELRAKGESLIQDLVKDVKDKKEVIKKIKAMTRLAKSIGEDTKEIEDVITATEAFSDTVLKRFDKTTEKE